MGRVRPRRVGNKLGNKYAPDEHKRGYCVHPPGVRRIRIGDRRDDVRWGGGCGHRCGAGVALQHSDGTGRCGRRLTLRGVEGEGGELGGRRAAGGTALLDAGLTGWSPSSRATSANRRPASSWRTASSLNSRLNFRRVAPIRHLPVPQSERDLTGCPLFRGKINAGLGRNRDAVESARHAVDLLPITREAYRGLFAVEALAQVYVMVGEHGAAVGELEMLLSVPSLVSAPLLRRDPRWRPLRNNSRFRQLSEVPQ